MDAKFGAYKNNKFWVYVLPWSGTVMQIGITFRVTHYLPLAIFVL